MHGVGVRVWNPWIVCAAVLACSGETPSGDDTGGVTTSSSSGDGSTTHPSSVTTDELPTSTIPTTTDSTTTSDSTTTDPTTTDPTTTSTGPMPECVELDDCQAAASECRQAVDCDRGTCVFADVPEGTPLADQVAGDCTVLACDGAGDVAPFADASDIEDDGVACTLDACDGTTPTHAPGMMACYSGPPDTEGIGACVAGVQVCDPDAPLGPCVGEVVPQPEDCDPDGVDEDCDGVSNESGAACICTPGEAVPCYDGPPGTLDVGACHAGTQVCDELGLGFSACTDQALPMVEDCGPGDVDEDCDGEVDESGPSCTCGDGDVSDGEVCDDGNDVDGDACSSDCQEAIEVVQLSTGQIHACALFSNGKVKCWGGNASGRLGLGDTVNRGDDPGEMGAALPFVDLGAGVFAVEIASSLHHTCVRTQDNKVKCWGSNLEGLLGLGDTNNRGDNPGEMGDALPYVSLGAGTPVALVAGGNGTSCVHLADGKIKCWGSNLNGELGQGNTQSRGDSPGEMGANLPTVPIGLTAVEVACGSVYVCARSALGIKCWGGNNGELGVGHGENVGDMPGELALPYIDLAPTQPVAMAPSLLVNCALMNDKSVRCWGSGVLGLGDTNPRGDDPGEMGVNLPPVDVGGPVEALYPAGAGACARLVGGAFKCWGDNSNGKLGLGDTNARGDAPGEMGAALPAIDLDGRTVVTMSSAVAFVCALLDDGSVKCWGQNDVGQLGLGDEEHRGDEPGEMGAALPAVQLL